MSISNANKQQICEQYHNYLKIIYYFGNKVMLLKQLWGYANEMGLARNLNEFYAQIAKLEKYEIFQKKPFTAYDKKTQVQVLVLRKYGIRFIEGKQDSYNVASLPVALSNERILVSMYKNCYIQLRLFPRIRKAGGAITFENINKILEHDCSTLLFNKNKGIDYLVQLINDERFRGEFDEDQLTGEINDMEAVKEKRLLGLRKGSFSRTNESKEIQHSSVLEETSLQKHEDGAEAPYVSPKMHRIQCFSVDTMLNCNYHITRIRRIKDRMHVTVLLFDINNKQDAHKIAVDIACLYHMVNRYLRCDRPLINKNNFKLNVGVVCLDESAAMRVKSDSEALVRNFNTKEVLGTRHSVTLENWNVGDGEQKQIEVHYVDYNITNDFLDGIKHANLIRR